MRISDWSSDVCSSDLLAFMHRDDLFPPERSAVNADDPVARCLAERAVDIDKMAAEGTVTGEQAALFKSRAEALCQDTVGGGSAPPPPPQYDRASAGARNAVSQEPGGRDRSRDRVGKSVESSVEQGVERIHK